MEACAVKLNWAERLVVNNPARILQQQLEVNWLKKQHPCAPGGAVLEIGCGRGAAAGLIRKACNPARLVLLDLDEAMIDKAARTAAGNGPHQTSCAAADVTRLPFKGSVFDAVFGFGVLHHVEDWRAGLAEISRVLKPGGVYYLEELYPSLYQNRLTRKILLHPEQGRFRSSDLLGAFPLMKLILTSSCEIQKLGILAVLVKSAA
jgi:ubiquinone/menaquinone biosynthesis C-methylase UbiE